MKKEDIWNQEINPDGISETLENHLKVHPVGLCQYNDIYLCCLVL